MLSYFLIYVNETFRTADLQNILLYLHFFGPKINYRFIGRL